MYVYVCVIWKGAYKQTLHTFSWTYIWVDMIWCHCHTCCRGEAATQAGAPGPFGEVIHHRGLGNICNVSNASQVWRHLFRFSLRDHRAFGLIPLRLARMTFPHHFLVLFFLQCLWEQFDHILEAVLPQQISLEYPGELPTPTLSKKQN